MTVVVADFGLSRSLGDCPYYVRGLYKDGGDGAQMPYLWMPHDYVVRATDHQNKRRVGKLRFDYSVDVVGRAVAVHSWQLSILRASSGRSACACGSCSRAAPCPTTAWWCISG